MTTEVSTNPLAIGDSATGRRVLIEDGVQVGPEPLGIYWYRLREHRQHRISRHQAMSPKRDQFAHGHAVAGHNERLPRVERTHDGATVVPQLPLGDFASHRPIVAPALRCGEGATYHQRPWWCQSPNAVFAMISFMTSSVPPPMRISRESRKYREMPDSAM
jgi:hypothetical protein